MSRTLLAAMASLGLAAAAASSVLAQDAPITTAPVATAPEAAGGPALTPSPVSFGQSAASAPTDDYGYVAWCYGAVAGYVDLYDTAMPEVTRIERAFPTPSTEENITKVYPEQRDTAKASLVAYRQAMTAAEKASARPINAAGTAALSRGRGIWAASRTVPKAQLAQFWMGWTPPGDCDTRAQTLLTRSNLFGQALSFNATAADAPVPAADIAAPAAPNAEAPASSIDSLLSTPPAPGGPATSESAPAPLGPL